MMGVGAKRAIGLYRSCAPRQTFDNSSSQGGDDTAFGIVSAGASIQYQDPGNGSRLFFFASRTDSSPDTVWCVKWDGASVSLDWSSNLPGVLGSPNVDGSPIRFDIYGGRIYVGTNAGEVVALDAATGNVVWIFDSSDGAIKGFLFPRFGTTDLFFSTINRVWSLRDDGASYSVNSNWPAGFVPNPSTPVLVPGTSTVLVGSSDGHLYQLDAGNPATFLREKLGDASGGVGTPTVDVFNSFIYVGTEQGIFYSVTYPITP